MDRDPLTPTTRNADDTSPTAGVDHQDFLIADAGAPGRNGETASSRTSALTNQFVPRFQ